MLIILVDQVCDLSGRPIRAYNTPSGGWMNIFIDFTFACQNARIVRHEFYAATTGTVHIGVWRPVYALNYKLIGYNTMEVLHTGAQVSIEVV